MIIKKTNKMISLLIFSKHIRYYLIRNFANNMITKLTHHQHKVNHIEIMTIPNNIISKISKIDMLDHSINKLQIEIITINLQNNIGKNLNTSSLNGKNSLMNK